VALMIVALERFGSAWGISLVLLADLLPAMLLGPLFGAAADRWSRKGCSVVADMLRAVAFAGIALFGSFEATVAFAVVAGIGTGLFTPAALASLPSLVEERRLPAATSLYGAIADLGFTAGPALAAVMLVLGSPETLMAVNAVTFALSALALSALPFGAAPAVEDEEASPAGRSLLAEAREGLRITARIAGLRVVLVASAAGLFFGGLFNIAELPFASDDLDAGNAGFAVLAALYGAGFITGSLAGAGGGEPAELKRRYLVGLAVIAGGLLASGLAPVLWVALVTFAVAGFGNGLMLVYERLLIQATVPDRYSARVFGVKDALTAWAFAVAFLSAGGLIALTGPRDLIVLAGAGGLVVWAIALVALRRHWTASTESSPVSRRTIGLRRPRADAPVQSGGRLNDGAQLLHGGDFWLALLDDLDERRGDVGVELAPGVRRYLG
jgi:MFS family permease